jgi:diketogulonate reductase-like aldo/keto reductase
MDPRRRALLAAAAAAAINPALAQRTPTVKKIPATGEPMPVVGLGTWQSFDVSADAAARGPLREVLQGLVRAGGRMVDSSPMYGAAESVVGDLLADLGIREKLFIATKVWTSGRAEGARQMQNSFKRLRADRIDLMQVHNLVDVETQASTLQDMKQRRKLRYIGITHSSASAHAEVERQLKAGQYDFVQINYSLGEPQAERRVLPLAREKGIAVIANRPFAEGALFRRVKGRPLPPWSAELGIESWAQYFLKWIVSHPAVTCAIPGTGNPKHMADNLAAGTGALPDRAARKRMADYFSSL